jgi:methylenetetrahydrofolate reductase (NADPH)
LDRWGDDQESLREAGIIYASEQISDLLARGIDGIHLYTMNHAGTTRRIWNNTHTLFER